MVRARSCFEVSEYKSMITEVSDNDEDRRQLFTEDEISEDVVLGSRLHAAGFKGVFIAENLATGEVCGFISELGPDFSHSADDHCAVMVCSSVGIFAPGVLAVSFSLV